MKLVLLVSALSFSLFAQAQSESNLIREARATMNEVRDAAPFLSPQEEQPITQHLRAIRAIARGESGGQRPPTKENYVCVSRDKDDRNPYVLGVREGLNVERIRQAEFSTMPQCEDTLAKARRVRGFTLICLSRDNDSKQPFQIATLNGMTVTRLNSTIVNTLEACQQTVQTLRIEQGSRITFCGSRDNDGRAPYQALSLDIATNQLSKGTEVFDTMEKCKAFLGQGK
jgi:hypothetical protein